MQLFDGQLFADSYSTDNCSPGHVFARALLFVYDSCLRTDFVISSVYTGKKYYTEQFNILYTERSTLYYRPTKSCNMALEFTVSEKGKRKLLVDGHLYVKDKAADTKMYWKCEKFAIMKCHARVHTEVGR